MKIPVTTTPAPAIVYTSQRIEPACLPLFSFSVPASNARSEIGVLCRKQMGMKCLLLWNRLRCWCDRPNISPFQEQQTWTF